MVVFSQDKVRAEELQGVVQDLRLAWSSGARDAEFQHEETKTVNSAWRNMENTNIFTNIYQYPTNRRMSTVQQCGSFHIMGRLVLVTHRFMFEMWSLSRVQRKSL